MTYAWDEDEQAQLSWLRIWYAVDAMGMLVNLRHVEIGWRFKERLGRDWDWLIEVGRMREVSDG